MNNIAERKKRLILRVKNESLVTYICPICDGCFSDPESWKSHATYHLLLPCHICDKQFPSIDYYKKHVSDVHCTTQSTQTDQPSTNLSSYKNCYVKLVDIHATSNDSTKPKKNNISTPAKTKVISPSRNSGNYPLENVIVPPKLIKIGTIKDAKTFSEMLLRKRVKKVAGETPPLFAAKTIKLSKNTDLKVETGTEESVTTHIDSKSDNPSSTVDETKTIGLAIETVNSADGVENIIIDKQETREQNSNDEIVLHDSVDDVTMDTTDNHSAFDDSESLASSYTENEDSDEDDSHLYPDRPAPLSKSRPSNCAICNEVVEDLIGNNYAKVNNKIRCLICGRRFANLASFVEHEHEIHFSTKATQKWVSCKTCLGKVSQSHGPQVTPDSSYKEYRCSICAKGFNHERNLLLHGFVHYDRVVYFCDLCPRKSIGRGRYEQHEKIHQAKLIADTNKEKNRKEKQNQYIVKPAGKHECDICGRISVSRMALNRHIKTVHSPKTPVQCHLCKSTFLCQLYLDKHLKTIHIDPPSYTCHFCGKTFRNLSGYQRHIKTHTGEKPFSCSICGKSFADKYGLKKHNYIHTGEKPFACEKCPKVYRDYTDLLRHRRIHGGVEKKIKCDLCDSRFYEKKHLRAHMASSHNSAQ